MPIGPLNDMSQQDGHWHVMTGSPKYDKKLCIVGSCEGTGYCMASFTIPDITSQPISMTRKQRACFANLSKNTPSFIIHRLTSYLHVLVHVAWSSPVLDHEDQSWPFGPTVEHGVHPAPCIVGPRSYEQQRHGDLVWRISTLIYVSAKQLMGVCSGAVRRPDHVKKLIDTSSGSAKSVS